jgi:hypothetical protein
MGSSGFRVLFSEGGDFLYKGNSFPSFHFSPSPLLLYQTLHPSCTSSIIMASYAEDILRAAREAGGPSIRDMESIRCFQSCPTTKDAVRVFPFNSLTVFS